MAPGKTPLDALKRVTNMLKGAMNAPEMQPKYVQQGIFKVDSCGAPFGEFLRNITADYERVTQAAGMKAN